MNCTLPSHIAAFTPPPCRLRDCAEVISVPPPLHPIPNAAAVGEQYPPLKAEAHASCSSSPPSVLLQLAKPSPPSMLLGLGLYEPRPAFTMLAPGNPRAQTPRGSLVTRPARSSASIIVWDVPSTMSAILAP